MSLRFVEAEPLVAWLAPLLQGAPLQAVHHPDPDTLILRFRRPGETIHLLLATGNGRSRIHTVDRPPPSPPTALAFQGLLRKHLRGRLDELTLVGNDRVVRLVLEGPEGVRTELIAELTDRHGNLFLVDADGRILGSARRSSSTRRELDRGRPWQPPASHSGPTEDRYGALQGAERDQAIRTRYDEHDRQREQSARSRALQRLVRDRVKALLRRLERQEREAARGEEAAVLRQEGDLLRSAFHRLRRGQEELEVADLFEPEGPMRTLQLDPALGPADQVEARYKAAKRAERSAEQAGARAAETRAQLGALVALQERTASGGADQLDALIAALPADIRKRWASRDPMIAGRPAALPSRGRAKGARGQRRPYRSYLSPGGFEILVGRGARDNDELTLRIARGNDLFFHVRGRPGAHVIVCRPGDAPTPELLVLAAQLAMAHSGVGDGDRAEVLWTRVKEVRKPKGMAPGAVLLRSEKVLYLEADRRVLDQLEAGPRE